MQWQAQILPALNALLIGIVGAIAAWWLHVPAPFLTGPATFVSIAAVLGVNCKIPNKLRDACFIIIGLVLGSSVTPEILAAAAAWPLSLIGMCISVAIIMLSGGIMFRRGFGMSRKTALLASSPGHLSYVISFSTDIGADTAIISVIQSIRVLFLTLAVPVAVALFTTSNMEIPPLTGAVLPVVYLAALALLAAALGMVLVRLKVPAAFLISGMIVSSIGHATSLSPGSVMPEISTVAFIIMGSLIGTRFSGVPYILLKKAAFGGVLLTFMGLAISISAAMMVAYLVGIPLIDIIIAFAPGGLETMVAMGAIVGADPAYVALHHVARLFFLSAFVPFALSRWGADK